MTGTLLLQNEYLPFLIVICFNAAALLYSAFVSTRAAEVTNKKHQTISRVIGELGSILGLILRIRQWHYCDNPQVLSHLPSPYMMGILVIALMILRLITEDYLWYRRMPEDAERRKKMVKDSVGTVIIASAGTIALMIFEYCI